MEEYYREDLAFIHDVGHRDFALKSAPGLLDILKQYNIHDGLVVDLGCGSGLWAQELIRANYDVLGVDISTAMIDIARKRVPSAEFQVGSFFNTNIPMCNAVTSLGECLNYLFDSDHDKQTLVQLFHRIHRALKPGGVLIFDVAEPGQIRQGSTIRGFSEGEDWIVVLEKHEDRSRGLLTRRITSFRKVGEYYRRDDEVHRQQLYQSTDIARSLRDVGFRVRVTRRFGGYELPKAHVAFIARKPV